MGGMWPYSCCFVECCFQDLFKAACLSSFHLAFSPSIFLGFKWCNRTVVLTQLQLRIPIIFYQKSDYHMIDNQSTAVHAFPMCMLISLSEIILPRYVNLSINFRGLLFNVEMVLSCLKHMNSVLSEFTWGPMNLVSFSNLCNRDSAWYNCIVCICYSFCGISFISCLFLVCETIFFH